MIQTSRTNFEYSHFLARYYCLYIKEFITLHCIYLNKKNEDVEKRWLCLSGVLDHPTMFQSG